VQFGFAKLLCSLPTANYTFIRMDFYFFMIDNNALIETMIAIALTHNVNIMMILFARLY